MLSKIIQHGTATRAQEFFMPSADLPAADLPVSDIFPPLQEAATSQGNLVEEQAHARHVAEAAAHAAHLQNQITALQNELARVESDALERGRQQGQAQAQAELSPVLQRLQGAIADTINLRAQLRHSTEKDLIQLALKIARRVLHRELQVDDTALGALARFAFDRMSRAEKYRIRVHPRFAAAIEQSLTRRQDISVQIDADPTCAPGTLEIQTDQGGVDASVDSQLEEIARGLVDRIA